MTGPFEYIEDGDAVAAMVDILLNFTPELDFTSGHPTISTNLIGYNYGDRWVRITQLGSIEEFISIDKPRIDFEVYAERRSIAFDIAKICKASVKYQIGRYRGFGLVLGDAEIEQGIMEIPDKLEESSRCTFSYRLTVKATGIPLSSPS